MKAVVSIALILLVLLQAATSSVLVASYHLQQDYITRAFCINKARPQLHCNGKCHLAKQLRKAADAEQKQKQNGEKDAPATPLLCAAWYRWTPPVRLGAAARRFPPLAVAAPRTPCFEIFTPPRALNSLPARLA